MSKKIRLHQFLSRAGLFRSKYDLFAAIKNGAIKVDNETVTSPNYFVKKSHKVFYKGSQVNMRKDKIYLLLNKPTGYLSSKITENDKKLGKVGVFYLLRDIDDETKKTLFCVGRLDENTSGLLIITNDGELSSKITDPNSNIEKLYEVELEKPVSLSDKNRIEKGIKINLEENGVNKDYKTKPCKIDIQDNRCVITVSEGKKREVRRMFEAVGNKVLRLKRVCIGKLDLRKLNIPVGKYKEVEKEFILGNI
jgi:pseudouridine synthase